MSCFYNSNIKDVVNSQQYGDVTRASVYDRYGRFHDLLIDRIEADRFIPNAHVAIASNGDEITDNLYSFLLKNGYSQDAINLTFRAGDLNKVPGDFRGTEVAIQGIRNGMWTRLTPSLGMGFDRPGMGTNPRQALYGETIRVSYKDKNDHMQKKYFDIHGLKGLELTQDGKHVILQDNTTIYSNVKGFGNCYQDADVALKNDALVQDLAKTHNTQENDLSWDLEK